MNDPINDHNSSWVLFIEDDTELRMTVELMIQENGFKVLSAANGVDAIKILIRATREDHLPSVILTNLNMPVFSGWEILELLDVIINPKIKAIPVVITSGEAAAPALDSKYRVLRKPYTETQVMAEIRRGTS